MTNQEQIDKWEEEFHCLMEDTVTNDYCILLHGFLMAKRAQKVIEIEASSLFGTDALIAIQEAGYQYTIMGE